MALIEKLEKLKKLNENNKETDWDVYKDDWKKAIFTLEDTIHKWFIDYEEKGLMTFSIVHVKRIEPYIGEYFTTILEITLSENKFLVLEPVSAVTTEYDGKLEFYMRGNVDKKVSLVRKIIDLEKYEWLIARSYNKNEHQILDKSQLEKLIEEWLQ